MPKVNFPKDSKDLTGFSAFMTNLKTQFASAASVYEGPTKDLFNEVVGKFEAVLAGLPKDSDGNWQLTDKLDWLFECLSSCNSLLAQLGLELSKAKQTMASAAGVDTLAAALSAGTHVSREQVDKAVADGVAAAIAQRTGETGDLIARTQVDQLCSAAKLNGVQEGRAQLQSELDAKAAAEKLAGERSTALTTAGIPVPEAELAEVLRASEENFAAARTTAENRIKALTEAGVQLPEELLASNVWADEKTFNSFKRTVTTIGALKKGPAPEPFATPPAGGNGAPGGKRMLA